jgi:uncharacterized protein (DUF1697 family)
MNTGSVRAPVAEQRLMAEAMGLKNPRTLLASGNLVVESDRDPGPLETEIEAAMTARFGLTVAAVVRTAQQWKALVAAKREGRAPDPIHGLRGKQRSTLSQHETFSLPSPGPPASCA